MKEKNLILAFAVLFLAAGAVTLVDAQTKPAYSHSAQKAFIPADLGCRRDFAKRSTSQGRVGHRFSLS